MTDPTPAKTPAPRATAAKPAVAKAAAAKPAAAKPASTKTATAKPAARKPAAAESATSAPTASAGLTPVVPAPVIVVPAAATAPAGWYPVAPGSPQQRWWDGTAWTQHVHDPAAARPAATVDARRLKAPEGTKQSTVWMWLTALSPIVALVSYVFLSVYFTQFVNLYEDTTTSFTEIWTDPAYLTYLAIGFVALAASIVFPILDWRVLSRRGVPKPFHWAWSLAALILSTPAIYVIGRTVVARRRTGKGLAPMWVFIAVQVVTWIVGAVVIVIFIIAAVTQFANLFNDSNEIF